MTDTERATKVAEELVPGGGHILGPIGQRIRDDDVAKAAAVILAAIREAVAEERKDWEDATEPDGRTDV